MLWVVGAVVGGGRRRRRRACGPGRGGSGGSGGSSNWRPETLLTSVSDVQ